MITVLKIIFGRAAFSCWMMFCLTSCGPGTFLGTWSEVLSTHGQRGKEEAKRQEKAGAPDDGAPGSIDNSSIVRRRSDAGRGAWLANGLADRVHTIIGFESRDSGFLTVHETGPQTGLAVAAGDLNGAGRDDVILGAPESDGPLPGATASGWVYVIFGREHFPKVLDLKETKNLSLWAGRSGRNRLGQTIITADLNDDGLSDVIIGAPHASPHRRRDDKTTPQAHAGSVFVLYGRRDWADASQSSRIIDLSQRADVIIQGAQEGDLTGFALAAGDVNGDHRQDLLIGAPGGGDAGDSGRQTGVTYVIYGRSHFPGILQLSETWDSRLHGIDGTRTRLTLTKNRPDRSGTSLAAGDVNADGIDDVIIGAPFGDGFSNDQEDSGECYVIFGDNTLPREFSIGTQADVIIYGTEPFARSGQMVTIGDVNHDGVGDVVIGLAEHSRHVDDSAKTGTRNLAQVVYGDPHLSPTLFINHEAEFAFAFPSASDSTFSATAWETFLPESLSFLPKPILIFDQNHDERDDVLVGLPGSRRFSGLSSPAFQTFQTAQAIRSGALNLFLSQSNHGLSRIPQVIQSPAPGGGAMFGASLAQGDFNGDGRSDFLVGASSLQRPAHIVNLFGSMRPVGGGYLFLGKSRE